MLGQLWQSLKRWRRIAAGPVTLHVALRRTVRVRKSRWHHLSLAAHPSAESAGQAARSQLSEAGVSSERPDVAVIVGVGPGLGHALASELAEAGMTVVVVSRDGMNQDRLVERIRNSGGRVHSYACDATDESAVCRLLSEVTDRLGVPALVVYSLQWFARTQALQVSVPEFEDAWRHNCLGPFLVSREVGRLMQRAARGTIVLVGSTSSVRAREEHLSFAVGKFGMRALAHVLAQELWPTGIHVVHLIIDADIREHAVEDHTQADPAHIAQTIHLLHRQPRSAWTSELDLRPWNERFWEHC